MSQVLKTNKLPTSASVQDQALLIFMVDDLEITTRKWQSRGVQFLTLPHEEPDWSIFVVHFRDREGNVIEIHSIVNRNR